jgi:hypothetical protein
MFAVNFKSFNMKWISIISFFFLTFAVNTAKAQCRIVSDGTRISAITQQSWGQTFVPGCSMNINFLTFNTATAVNSSFTFTLRSGSDCNGAIIYTQKLAKIVNGENRVNFETPIPVLARKTYYFSVESDLNNTFQIRFSLTSLIPGNLKTYNTGSAKTACDRDFPDYDWNFNLDTIVQPSIPPFPTLGQNVDLIIWAGQSNAQGAKGDGAYYPADSSNFDSFIGLNYKNILTSSSSGYWIKMQPQLGEFTKGHFGPEVTFSRKLKEAGFNPAIFKYTRGGTSIYSFWKTPGAGGYYDSLKLELKKAITALELKGFKVTIRGFVWIQGESDAEPTASPLYYSSLLSILRDIRSNVAKNTNLPIVLGVDEQFFRVVNFPIVLESQKRIASEETNVVFTSMYDLQKADETHLTPAGLIAHGIRIFDAYKMLNLMSSTSEIKTLNYKLFVIDNRLIGSTQGANIELSVFDMLGHLITYKSSQQGNVDIPLKKGCYIVKMDINKQQIIRKIII